MTRVLGQTPTDTGRVTVLSLLASAYAETGNLDLADSLARHGEALAHQLNFKRGIGLNRLRQAFVRINRRDLDAARRLTWQALYSLHTSRSYTDAALGHSYLGGIYNIEDQIDSARWHFDQVLQLGTKRMKAIAHLNLGVIEANAGRHPQALDRYLKALRVAQDLGEQRLEATLMLNIGSVYVQLGEEPQAIDWYERTIALLERHRIDDAALALAYYNAGSAASKAQSKERKSKLMQRAFALADSIGDVNVIALAGASLGQEAIDRRDWPQARQWLSRAQAAANAWSDNENKARVANAWARYHTMRHEWSVARRHAQQAIDLLQQAPKASELVLAYEAIYQADSAEGRLADALKHYKLRTAWRDSLREQSQALEIGRIEARHQAERELEAERERLEAQIARRDRWLVGVGVGLALLVGVALLLNYLRRLQRKRNRLLRTLTNRIYQQKAEIEAQTNQIATQRDELEAANRKLVELDRLKEELSGMIVHDLKNPLNAILTLTTLPPDESRLLMMRAAGQQMNQLVSNLLDVQKYENDALKLNPEPTKALTLINRAVEQVTLLAEAKGIGFRLQIELQLVVEADPELMVRVLVNLLTNAIKYAPAGDTLDLEAQHDAERGAVFRVTDHGQGIPRNQLERVFEKFAQIDGGRASGRLRSTGLGLTFCRLTVEAHGGHIRAHSEEGCYTTFEFNLPKAFLEKTPLTINSVLNPNSQSLPELPAALRHKHANILSTLAETPLYELSLLYDLLDQIAEPEAQAWRNAVELAVLAGLDSEFQLLVGSKSLDQM